MVSWVPLVTRLTGGVMPKRIYRGLRRKNRAGSSGTGTRKRTEPGRAAFEQYGAVSDAKADRERRDPRG